MRKHPIQKSQQIDASQFAKKINLANPKSDVDELDIDEFKTIPISLKSLKIKVDKLDVDKLKPVPVNLKKIGDVVEKDFVKKN